MQGVAAVALVLALLVFAAPSAASQSLGRGFGGVDKCAKACEPSLLNGATVANASKPVWLILYGHVENVLSSAPMNTQRPNESEDPDRRMPPRHCVQTRTGTPQDVRFGVCTLKFFSSPGVVEYLEAGWRTHQQPGLSRDVPLFGEGMWFYLTLSPTAPSPIPHVHVKVETGGVTGRGEVIAQSSPMVSPVQRVVATSPADPYDAWELEVPLALRRAVLPADGGFHVTVTLSHHDNPAASVLLPTWEIRVGAKFPPRLVLQTVDPLQTLSSSISRREGSTFLRWSILPALGSYDLQDASLRLESVGERTLPMAWLEHLILKRSVDHDGQFKPVNSTWRLNHTRHEIPDGRYELRASIVNLQGTYRLEHQFGFDVVGGVPRVPDEVEFKGRATPSNSLLDLLVVGALATFAAWKGKGFQAAPSRQRTPRSGSATDGWPRQ